MDDMAKRVKTVRPMLMLMEAEFRKTCGATVRQASYADKAHIVILLPCIIALAMLVITQEAAPIPGAVWTALRVVAMLIFAAEFLFAFVEGVRYEKRLRDFYLSAIERGGETVDARTEKAVRYYRDRGYMVYIANGTLLAVFASFLVLPFIPVATDFVSGLLPFYYITLIANARNVYGLYSPTPIIFLDLNEGMIIGQTIFPYAVLGDLRETGADRYELWYDGKAVMRGTLPKEVVSLWRETAAIVAKYGSYLNGGAEIDA
jgi:hypothetical protein